MISSVQTNVHNIYACVSRDFDLRCFLGKPGILDRRPASISVGIPACHTPVTANISNVTAKRVDAGITGTVKSSSSAPRATARRTGNSAPEVKGNGPGGTWPKTQRIGYELFARSAGKNVAGESAFIMPNRFWSAISAICARCRLKKTAERTVRTAKLSLRCSRGYGANQFGPRPKQLKFADQPNADCPF
jgi:hypothetical protein